MSANPYLEGNFGPVTEEVTAFDLRVTGEIPRELSGRLLRIGPNPIGTTDPAKYHWFTGNGMVHGLRLRDGRAEWYRNRWVADDGVTAFRNQPKTPGPRHGMGVGVANTNVIGFANRTWAIVEAGGLPVELSDELETKTYSDFDGTLPGSFTAHPKVDPDTGELHAMVYYWAWDYVQYVVVGTDGRVRKTVNVTVPGKPMMHDFALTERHVVIFDLPCTFDAKAGMSGPFPYVWNPDYGARVGLLPRDGKASGVRWFEVPLCYVFHPMNAYETADGQVVMDVCRHPKMFDRDKRGPNEGAPTLDRWVIDPSSGKVATETISDLGHEFPRHDERRIGKSIRFGYTGSLGNDLAIGPIYKHDLAKRTTEIHGAEPGRMFLEPVFVPRTPDADEDDGWILAYVYDAPSNGSEVVILHAQDFTGKPVARIHLPQRVPFGFHGNWVPDRG